MEVACQLPDLVPADDEGAGLDVPTPRADVLCRGYADHTQADELILTGMLTVLIFPWNWPAPPQSWEARVRQGVDRALVEEATATLSAWYDQHAARYLADPAYLESVRRSKQRRH